jgi:hypothetical protein
MKTNINTLRQKYTPCKSKTVLCSMKHCATEKYGGVEVQLPAFLTLAEDEDVVSFTSWPLCHLIHI